jgi:glycosyltransferase involved in cell wall biosynthesis
MQRSPYNCGALNEQRFLRVLHIVPTLGGGGAERLVATLTHHLRLVGIDAAIMTIDPSEVQQPLSSEVPLVRVDRGKGDLGFVGRMVSTIRQWKPAVVHTHLHKGFWGRIAAIAAGVPVIVHTEHNPCFLADSVVRILGYRALTMKTTAFITFSQFHRRYLAAHYGVPAKKISVICNGIVLSPEPGDAERSRARDRLRIGPNELAVFVVASLQPVKNHALAISAAARLSQLSPRNIRMYFFGTGEEEQRLRQMARELRVHERVIFSGYCSDVEELLPGADLFFMPSQTEGMPLAMLEAMSLGIPALATPWPGAAEFLEGGRLATILPGWDAESAASIITQMLAEPVRSRAKAREAQKFVRSEYDLTRIASLHRELYLDLLDRKSLRCPA